MLLFPEQAAPWSKMVIIQLWKWWMAPLIFSPFIRKAVSCLEQQSPMELNKAAALTVLLLPAWVSRLYAALVYRAETLILLMNTPFCPVFSHSVRSWLLPFWLYNIFFFAPMDLVSQFCLSHFPGTFGRKGLFRINSSPVLCVFSRKDRYSINFFTAGDRFS